MNLGANQCSRPPSWGHICICTRRDLRGTQRLMGFLGALRSLDSGEGRVSVAETHRGEVAPWAL